MSEWELKPCPFCGEGALVRTHRVAEDAEVAYVACDSCGCRTDEHEDAYAPVPDAVAAWNRRVGSSRPAEQVEKEDRSAYE